METYPFIPSQVYRGSYHFEEHGPRGPGYYLLVAQQPHTQHVYHAQRGVAPPSNYEAAPRGGSGVASLQGFYPSPYFQGHLQGYVFTTRHLGTGYYFDRA